MTITSAPSILALSFALALAAPHGASARAMVAPPTLSPGEIVAAAPVPDWVTVPPDDVLVIDLAPTAAGIARRVVIQLAPSPVATAWTANVRTLAHDHWWDGLSINRVQDNYVVQWGDPASDDRAHARPLPPGLKITHEADYTIPAEVIGIGDERDRTGDATARMTAAMTGTPAPRHPLHAPMTMAHDSYAPTTRFWHGWPFASDGQVAWPVHCYAAVGVGRNLPPDAGTGAELYAVIGQAPRHLDRNIALVGRVVGGIEWLSSLPRGTGDLGFYRTPGERTTIVRVRLASELPPAERPTVRYLSTESSSFAAYAEARANRRDAFFIRPAGGADICNIPVPVEVTPPPFP